MQHARQEMVALHLGDAQFDEDRGLAEASCHCLQPVPVSLRETAALAVLRQAHVGEGQEDDSLPKVVIAACALDEVLQPDGLKVQVSLSRVRALEQGLQGEPELVPNHEDSLVAVLLQALRHERVNLVRLVSPAGCPQIVEEVNDSLAHVPVAELLQGLVIEVPPKRAHHLLRRGKPGPGHSVVLLSLCQKMFKARRRLVEDGFSQHLLVQSRAAQGLEKPSDERRGEPAAPAVGVEGNDQPRPPRPPAGDQGLAERLQRGVLPTRLEASPDGLERRAVEAVMEEAGEDRAQAAFARAVSAVADDGPAPRRCDPDRLAEEVEHLKGRFDGNIP